jgi:hypothetical protein
LETPEEQLLTAQQLAEALHRSTKWVNRRAYDGSIPFYRSGSVGPRLFRLSEVLATMSATAISGAEPRALITARLIRGYTAGCRAKLDDAQAGRTSMKKAAADIAEVIPTMNDLAHRLIRELERA